MNPKVGSEPVNPSDTWGFHKKLAIKFHDSSFDPTNQSGEIGQKAFYMRTAYRNEPDFSAQSITPTQGLLEDHKRPQLMMHQELRVSDNYARMVNAVTEKVFDYTRDPLASEMRNQELTPIREAMGRVFGDLVPDGLSSPTVSGTFLFEKGKSKGFKYKNLSGGEKAAFDLLLDFYMKTPVFNDTVFCIDEPELHMHSKLQAKLLEELYGRLPPNCQMWISTHSIGMMRQAMEIWKRNHDEVIFLDFEGHDFDRAVHLQPVKVDRQFWKRVFTVALDDLAELVGPSEVVFCEGRPENKGRRATSTFDADIYRRIFGTTHPDTEFIPLGGTTDIEKNVVLLDNVFTQMFTTMKTWKLIDRDDRSDENIKEMREHGTRILNRRDLENYLWDDEVLTALCKTTNNANKTQEVLALKAQLLSEAKSKGYSADDVKYISRSSGRLAAISARITASS